MSASLESLSLGWISLDLDEHIDAAKRSFEAFLSNPEGDDEANKLVETQEQVSACAAILQDTGLDTASKYACDLGDLVQKLIVGEIKNQSDAYQVVIGGLNQLVNYLSRVKNSGSEDGAMILSVVNDIRALSGKSLNIPASDFNLENSPASIKKREFSKQLKAVDWAIYSAVADSIASSMVAIESTPDDQRTSLLAIKDAIESTLGTDFNSLKDIVGEVFVAISAIVNGALKNGNRLPIAAKYTILKAINLIDRIVSDSSAKNINNSVDDWKSLFNEIFFCAAISADDSESYQFLSNKYALSSAISLDESSVLLRLGTPDVETMDIVLGGLLDDIIVLQNALQACSDAEGDLSDSGDLSSMAANLQYTAQIAQLYDVAANLASISESLAEMQQAGHANFAALETVATQLFDTDTFLRKLRSGSDRDESELTLIDQVKSILMNAQSATSECIAIDPSSVVDFEQDINQRLAPITGQLTEIRGVIQFIKCDKLESTLNLFDAFFENKISSQIESEDLSAIQVACGQLDAAILSFGHYLDAIKQSKHTLVDNLLNDVAQQLQLSDGEQVEAAVAAENTVDDVNFATEESVIEESVTEEGAEVEEQVDTETSGTVYTEVALEGEFDDEIVEIFLEEAEEVLETINENQVLLAEAMEFGDPLAEIRRGYHTLKGSGRMAGAEHIGEAAWSVESLLNRIMEKSVPLDENRVAFVAEANQYMPIIIQNFQQRLVPFLPAMEDLIARAETLANDSNATVSIGDSLSLEQNKASGEPAVVAEELVDEVVEEIVDETTEAVEETTVEAIDDVVDEAVIEEDVIEEDVIEESAEEEPAIDFNQMIQEPLEGTEADSVQPETESHDTIDNENIAEESQHSDAEVEGVSASEEQSLTAVYVEEAGVQLATLQAYFNCEANGVDCVVPDESIERAFHTLSGGAGIAGIQDIADIMAPAEILTGQVKRFGQIEADQFALLKRACHWLEVYLSGQLPDEEVSIPLMDEFSEAINRNLEKQEALGESNFDDVQSECSLILEPVEFLREWRVADVLPDQHAQMLQEFKNISASSETVQPVHDLCDALTITYQCFAESRLHFTAYDALMRAHADLANMLDRMAAGQQAESVAITDELQALVEKEQAIHAEMRNRKVETTADTSDSKVSDIDDEIVAIFLEESQDLIVEVESGIKGWLNNPSDNSHLESLLRPLHTIKGGARMAGLNAIGNLCHEFETDLQTVRNGTEEANAAFFKKINQYFSDLTDQFSDIEVGGESGKEEDASADKEKETKRVAEVIRVPADVLEQLVNLAGETSISRSLVEEQINEFTHAIDEIGSTVERLKEQLRRLEIETEAQINFRKEQVEIEGLEEFDPLEMDRYSHLQQLSKSLVESASDLKDLKGTLGDKTRDVETLLIQQARINTELQEGLMQTRTVPLSRTIVPRLRRTIRQVSGELDKPVKFEIGNTDGDLDRSVIERMVAPLEHVLRNAMDHGIESASVRKKLGKPESGTVSMDIHREGGDVVLKISDDGKGIDVAAVKKKAISLGLIDKNASLSDEDITQLVFSAGFSTAKKVTQISGRGVGMDVVQSEIRELGGSVELLSEKDKGTTFIFRLPFTVSMNRALLVSAGGESLAVPLNSVEGIVRVSPYELEEYYGENAVDFMYAGQQYDFRYMGTALNGSKPQYSTDMVGALPVLLVRAGDSLVAFQVDRLLGSREIVVKGLGSQFSELQGISGATVLGDGSVVMIADLAAIVRQEAAQVGAEDRTPEQTSARDRAIAMVVDDSVTVRKVTTRLLERQGFDVVTAKDGLDAMEKLEEIKPDFMLLDIEMPRLDGFEVVSRVRHDERLADIPIIMITSRTGEKHKERALALGANEFLGKPYQDQVLFAKILEVAPELAEQHAIAQ